MDTEQVIEQAQAPAVFDVLSFLEETAYPVEKVTVFRDLTAAREYTEAVNKRNLQDEADAEESDLDAHIKQLGEKISSSAMIFELRGMPPGIVDKILAPGAAKDGDDPEVQVAKAQAADNELIARSIVSVTNAAGVKDSRIWNAEGVQKIREYLTEGEFSKLISGVASVNFNAAVFDQAVSAGFPRGRTDVA